jgi:predicted nucleic acid-binding protein
MSAEFVDTNVLVYAHDRSAGPKHEASVQLLTRLVEKRVGALSTQVLAEFYSAATRKLGMASAEAEDVIADLAGWTIHRPAHSDLLRASRLHRHHKIGWWDALIVTSALELGCRVLWTEDLTHGQRFGGVLVRNPYK